MTTPRRYWFPAKRYGYGWGPPATWEGWLVAVGYVALMILGAVWLPPDRALVSFIMYTAILSGALIAVCYATGEPPAWRWDEGSDRGTE